VKGKSPWTALRRALDVSVDSIANDSAGLRAARMQTDTPALRAAVQEKHRAWNALLVPHIIERLGGGSDEALHRIRRTAPVTRTRLSRARCLPSGCASYGQRKPVRR
jgi:hypothetical protein